MRLILEVLRYWQRLQALLVACIQRYRREPWGESDYPSHPPIPTPPPSRKKGIYLLPTFFVLIFVHAVTHACCVTHGNVILTKFWSLAAPEVVKKRTCGASSHQNFVEMTIFPFQCMIHATLLSPLNQLDSDDCWWPGVSYAPGHLQP